MSGKGSHEEKHVININVSIEGSRDIEHPIDDAGLDLDCTPLNKPGARFSDEECIGFHGRAAGAGRGDGGGGIIVNLLDMTGKTMPRYRRYTCNASIDQR